MPTVKQIKNARKGLKKVKKPESPSGRVLQRAKETYKAQMYNVNSMRMKEYEKQRILEMKRIRMEIIGLKRDMSKVHRVILKMV